MISEKKVDRYILDSYALLAFFLDEPSAKSVEGLLIKALDKEIVLYLTDINLGEVYYRVAKQFNHSKARNTVAYVMKLPIEVIEINTEFILKAAHWKSKYPISYADAFVVEAGYYLDAEVVTADPELDMVKEIKIKKI